MLRRQGLTACAVLANSEATAWHCVGSLYQSLTNNLSNNACAPLSLLDVGYAKEPIHRRAYSKQHPAQAHQSGNSDASVPITRFQDKKVLHPLAASADPYFSDDDEVEEVEEAGQLPMYEMNPGGQRNVSRASDLVANLEALIRDAKLQRQSQLEAQERKLNAVEHLTELGETVELVPGTWQDIGAGQQAEW